MILKWHLLGLHGDIKEVEQALIQRSHLKSAGKLEYTQYQEYYTARNGEKNTGCEDPGSGEQSCSYTTAGLYVVTP